MIYRFLFKDAFQRFYIIQVLSLLYITIPAMEAAQFGLNAALSSELMSQDSGQ